MTKAERQLASYLLNIAADRFHEDSCTDVSTEAFDGIDDIRELNRLEADFNAANSFGLDAEEYSWIPLDMVQIDQWMSYLADRILEEQ